MDPVLVNTIDLAIKAVFPWALFAHNRHLAIIEAFVGEGRRFRAREEDDEITFEYFSDAEPLGIEMATLFKDPFKVATLLDSIVINHALSLQQTLLGFLSNARMEWNQATYRTLQLGGVTTIDSVVFEQEHDCGRACHGSSRLRMLSNPPRSLGMAPSLSVYQTQVNGHSPWTWLWNDTIRNPTGGFPTITQALKALQAEARATEMLEALR